MTLSQSARSTSVLVTLVAVATLLSASAAPTFVGVPAMPELAGDVTATAAALALQEPAIAGALALHRETSGALDAFRVNLAPDVPFGDRLLRAGLVTLEPVRAQGLDAEDVGLDAALARLAVVAEREAVRVVADLDPRVAAELAPLVLATAQAAEATRGAFAVLTPEEQELLWAFLPDVVLGPGDVEALAPESRQALDLAARVDTRPVLEGAAVLANALDAFPRDLPLDAYPRSATCVDSACWIVVGGQGTDTYTGEHVLIVDPAGDDVYSGRTASFGPGSTLPVPVSAVLDLGGLNRYVLTGLNPGSATDAWGQAVGIGGIGLILDVGSFPLVPYTATTFTATVTNAATGCAWDPIVGSAARQMLFAQGVGVLGVGAIGTTSGVFEANNVAKANLNCHFGRVHTYAQAVGLHGGVGVVLVGAGSARFTATATAGWVDDNFAETVAQGAAAGGVGVLVKSLTTVSGDPHTFTAIADAQPPTNPLRRKGSFAYAFAQGVVAGTPHDPRNACDPTGAIGAPLGMAALCETGPGVGVLLTVENADYLVRAVSSEEYSGCSYTHSLAVGQGAAVWGGLAAFQSAPNVGRSLTVDAATHGDCTA